MSAHSQKKRFESYLWMLLNTLVWGASFIVVKPALDITSPLRHLLFRYLLAVIFSLPILYHYWPQIKKLKQKLFPVFWIELLGTVLALWILYEGLHLTSAIEANLLTMTLPVFLTIGGILFLKEKEERHEFIGLTITLMGTTLLVFSPLVIGGTGLTGLSFQGNILITASMIISAIYYLLAKKYYQKLPKFLVTTLSFYVGLIGFTLASGWELFIANHYTFLEGLKLIQLEFTQFEVWRAAGYMALFGSIIGLTAYYKGQDGIEASEAGLFTYLQPLVAIPLSMLFLKEGINFLEIIALLLILMGVYWAERRQTRKSKKQKS